MDWEDSFTCFATGKHWFGYREEKHARPARCTVSSNYENGIHRNLNAFAITLSTFLVMSMSSTRIFPVIQKNPWNCWKLCILRAIHKLRTHLMGEETMSQVRTVFVKIVRSIKSFANLSFYLLIHRPHPRFTSIHALWRYIVIQLTIRHLVPREFSLHYFSWISSGFLTCYRRKHIVPL